MAGGGRGRRDQLPHLVPCDLLCSVSVAFVYFPTEAPLQGRYGYRWVMHARGVEAQWIFVAEKGTRLPVPLSARGEGVSQVSAGDTRRPFSFLGYQGRANTCDSGFWLTCAVRVLLSRLGGFGTLFSCGDVVSGYIHPRRFVISYGSFSGGGNRGSERLVAAKNERCIPFPKNVSQHL